MAASPMNEMALKHLRDADSFSEMSVALHLVAEGNVLTLFRFSEYLSPTDVDKKIFRLVMQDEARHVGYGMQHFKYVLEHFPEKREVLHAHLDEAENISFAGAAATEVTESFIILAGGGMKKENIEEGIKVTTQFNLKQMHEHFERLEKCGMPERKRALEALQDVRDGSRGGRSAGIKLTSGCGLQDGTGASPSGILRLQGLHGGRKVLEATHKVMEGNLGLHWYNAKTERIRATRRIRSAD